MKNEDLEELSTGASVYLQGFMIGFCLLMAALTALFIPFRRLDFEGYLAVFLIFSALVLFAMLPLIYSDVYLSGDSIVIKKIIGTKRRPISDFKALDATILPFACYNFRIANALTILFFINTFRNSKKHHRFGYHKKSQMQD